MAKTRQQKEEIVAQIAEKFRSMKSAAFTSISGYTMAEADELREKAAEQDVEVFVAKKTLIALAIKEAGIEGLNPRDFKGSILTAVSFGDEVSAAKLLKEYTKQNDASEIVAGVLEGQGIDADAAMQLASLPSKEQLLAQLVGSLNAPVSGFVNVLAGNMRGLVTVLDSIREQKA